MKNILKFIGLFALILFSFFYTDKVMEVVNNQDEIMIKLKDMEDEYKVSPIEAIIDNDTIIPGINGKEIDIDKTYKYLRQVGIVDTSLFEYKVISPNDTLANNKDKYIIKANPSRESVSLLIILNSKTNIDKILSIVSNKGISVNFFIEYNYLVDNISILNKLKNYEVYSYIPYTPDSLIISNNIIKNKIGNKPIYCLAKERDSKILNICSNSNMYTILPNIVGGYTEVKHNISSGSLILISNDKINSELDTIISYIKSKGYSIDTLSSILSE